jgi:glycogen phosphorylase
METRIAYFSAEFGIDASLPIYSGGLGVLAGDHVKAANDLGLPLVAIGIFYRRGYFDQKITPEGKQEVLYPVLNPDQLPIEPVCDKHGYPLYIGLSIEKRVVYLRAWKVQVGNVPVYLLDADHDRNQADDRKLTHSLYGGTVETRIAQEMILGMGGVRLLRALEIEPDVWHMNEGHSAFLSLERIREYSAQGFSFETAVEAVKASVVFTTHTPVPAGHDQFPMDLVDRFLGEYYWQLGATREQILALGRVANVFNMTRLAVSTSSRVNGVSKLHAEVTKEMFHQHWMKHIPSQHIPVEAITNGIHTLTWLSPEMKQLYDQYLESDWVKKIAEINVWEGIFEIPNREVWDAHQAAKRKMFQRLGLANFEHVLTIGFARRFATYKRALLLFRDLPRLENIIGNSARPVCFLFAGKAHPADLPGQELIRRIKEISEMPAFKGKLFLLENYDMDIAKHLVQGVDVWLNTPQRPMEASGTSGQKAAVNGVLNFSVLDGWWSEGYNGRNGWSIEGSKDDWDSEELYRKLENEIIPLYYSRNHGYPAEWTAKMKESIRTLTPIFSTSCMVAEYWCRLYIPTAIRGRKFTENKLEVAEKVAGYKNFIRKHWSSVQIESIELIPEEICDRRSPVVPVSTVKVVVDLGAIWKRDVQVEAVGSNGKGGIWRNELHYVQSTAVGKHLFVGSFGGGWEDWIQADSNVRVIPISPDFEHDLELELSTWGSLG